MFDFLKPVVGVSRSDWTVIKGEVLRVAEAIGQRFQEHDAELERLANVVRQQEAAIDLLKTQQRMQQALERQPFAHKLRGKGRP